MRQRLLPNCTTRYQTGDAGLSVLEHRHRQRRLYHKFFRVAKSADDLRQQRDATLSGHA